MKSLITKTDVLICGAGAAGLTLAIDLARRGVSFKIIEKLPTPFAGSRGKGIQPRSQEIFEDLGVLDKIVAAGGTYPPEREYMADGTFIDTAIGEGGVSTDAEPYLTPLMVPQFLTEKVLRGRLSEFGVEVEFGKELLSFSQNSDSVTTKIQKDGTEEIINAKYLIGTDGGRSFIRHALNIEFAGETLGIRAIVADLIVEGVTQEAWHQWNKGNMRSQISLCPLRGAEMFQLQGPIPLEGDIDLSVEGISKLLFDRTKRKDIVVREVRWASAFNMNARLAGKYQIGRVFLCGDAAHIHPPTGGQGLNTSLQDSYNLGWKLHAVLEGASEKILQTYEEERQPIAKEMLGMTTKLLEALKKRGDMKRGRETLQLDLGYTESSIALSHPTRDLNDLIAGDRAPDALVKGAAGKSIRVFHLLKGPHWTLIGFNVHPEFVPTARKNLRIHQIGPDCEIIDEQESFKKNYSVNDGDWVLIRPDGYIGAIVSSKNLDMLKRYMADIGLGPFL